MAGSRSWRFFQSFALPITPFLNYSTLLHIYLFLCFFFFFFTPNILSYAISCLPIDQTTHHHVFNRENAQYQSLHNPNSQWHKDLHHSRRTRVRPSCLRVPDLFLFDHTPSAYPKSPLTPFSTFPAFPINPTKSTYPKTPKRSPFSSPSTPTAASPPSPTPFPTAKRSASSNPAQSCSTSSNNTTASITRLATQPARVKATKSTIGSSS